MTKFGNKYGTTRGTRGLTKTTGTTTNHGGALANTRDPKSDLFMLGVANFVGEDTFYESADDRDARFQSLVHTVTEQDPDWVARFVPWLRNEANMRSASLVAAIEYGRAGGPDRRQVVASAMSRADEPAEALAYWIGTAGRPIPSWLKRGAADGARRLYNQYSLLKYDGNSKQFRFGDVINLTHVKPETPEQEALFKFALDSRYGADAVVDGLEMVALRRRINAGDITRDQLLEDPELMKRAGMTWESLSGLGQMDARAWEAVIPNMGYMALLRNLRNFEQAGISNSRVKFVTDKLQDPEQVARSRQLPFRFWSAYVNTNSLMWASALETALELSLQNVPSLGGRSLILTDTSASMRSSLSGRSTVSPLQAAGVFTSALALKGEDVDFYGFADFTFEIEASKGGSILRSVEHLVTQVGRAGHGTNIPGAIGQWDGHDRVVIVTDMQTLGRYDRTSLSDRYSSYGYGARRDTALSASLRNTTVPQNVPIFGFNLGGYGNTQVDTEKNEFELGGLTDHTFKLIPMLERGAKSDWPF